MFFMLLVTAARCLMRAESVLGGSWLRAQGAWLMAGARPGPKPGKARHWASGPGRPHLEKSPVAMAMSLDPSMTHEPCIKHQA